MPSPWPPTYVSCGRATQGHVGTTDMVATAFPQTHIPNHSPSVFPQRHMWLVKQEGILRESNEPQPPPARFPEMSPLPHTKSQPGKPGLSKNIFEGGGYTLVRVYRTSRQVVETIGVLPLFHGTGGSPWPFWMCPRNHVRTQIHAFPVGTSTVKLQPPDLGHDSASQARQIRAHASFNSSVEVAYEMRK